MIQRIGRCLRFDPNNPQKRANIVDFIRTNDGGDTSNQSSADTERQSWLTTLSQTNPDQ
jgi:CRISPR/Cas system-associated endonuclease/helicase Cas3